ncbi:hypothetical protein BJ322DRAFT_1102345 [Thelephora terrestris]|uniref:SWR1-complex protein 4 n=1 Tax=Thelephora terrestris TaxID=56493 RepID=A0A9P6H4N5_9AGAM|nr:hypothetical protein BJ322DRAFT_1102345 [Thelephora terrestris]
MTSAADIRSVLSVPEPTPGSSQQIKKPVATNKRPQGISRELYELIGDSVPSVVPQQSKARLKLKPNLGSGPPRSRWEWREFRNGARTDGLRLSHWLKAGADPDAEDYDSRFLVIHDRYEFPGGVLRSLEDLKDRNRPWNGDESSRSKILDYWPLRKKADIIHTERSSPENNTSAASKTVHQKQIAEEEALYLELKRLEQTERQFKKDRDDLLRTLLGIESGLSDIQLSDDSTLHGLNTMPEIKKSKKRIGSSMEIDSPSTPSNSMIQQRRIPIVKNAAFDAQHCITRIDLPQTTVTKSSHQAAALRSYKIPTPKQAVATKVAQTLSEHGVNSSRLVMPTRENLLHLESLIEATTAVVGRPRRMWIGLNKISGFMKAKVLRRDGSLVEREAVADDDDVGIHSGRGARKKNRRATTSTHATGRHSMFVEAASVAEVGQVPGALARSAGIHKAQVRIKP